MDNEILYRITIKGGVQGVGFRWNALREANLRGIRGYVKNLSDGSVYIEAEGRKELLDDFLAWCRKGPRMSSVKSVDVDVLPPEGYSDFNVEH
jgi:acylphosphatase